MKLRQIIFTLFSLLLLNFSVLGQKSCLNTLREAKDLYEQGLIDEIPGLLSSCMETGFTRAQRIEAYKLIILAYLFDDDQFAAEKMMDEFLKKFPEYEVMPSDPVEFVYLLESYKTSSFYSINLTFGPTFTNPVILEPFSVLDMSNTRYSNTTGTGIQMGLGISRNLFKGVNGNIGFFYTTNRYTFKESTITPLNELNYAFADTRAEEELTRVDIPLSLTYNFGRGNLHYTARLGGLIGYITKANLSVTRSGTGLDNPISIPDIDLTEYRKPLDFAALVGAGIDYKIPRGFLVLEMRYRIGLTNVNLSDERTLNPAYISRYFHLDDDFRLNSFSIAFGYHFSIYQSKKNRF